MCVAWPLHNLNGKNVPFQWDDECKAVFLELKQWLTSTTMLVASHDVGTHVLDTDASNTALGAMLHQEQDSQLHVIAYASRALSHADKGLSSPTSHSAMSQSRGRPGGLPSTFLTI